MRKSKGSISALFQFNQFGNLKGVFLNSETEDDQEILQKGLSELLKPAKFSFIRALFQKRNRHG